MSLYKSIAIFALLGLLSQESGAAARFLGSRRSQRGLKENTLAKQTSRVTQTGTTSGSVSVSSRIVVTEDGIKVMGESSATSDGNGSTKSTTQTNGYVRGPDGNYVVNTSFGKTAAEGGEDHVATENSSWGSSEISASKGPDATAGHKVDAQGPMTASVGDQRVGVVATLPSKRP